MKNIACCIFGYDITKGMKSQGSISLLQAKPNSKPLIYYNLMSIKSFAKDIFFLLGFDKDKILKKIHHHNLSKNITIIHNDQYDIGNQGYAFKLFIDTLLNSDVIDRVDGVLFVNNYSIYKNIPKFSKDRSWILLDKKNNKPRYNIGCFIDNNKLRYMFYNLSDNLWAEVFYLTIVDIKTIFAKINDLYHANMFMFEILNIAIEKQNIEISVLSLDKSKDLVKISGVVDKSKIK